MALESYCAACEYLEEEADSNGKYYCCKKGYVYANDPKCYSFSEDYTRDRFARENMYENSDCSQGLQFLQFRQMFGNMYENSERSRGDSYCYLTTAMCSILSYPDDNYYLETLRSFRDNVLKNDINYIPLLLLYDNIGPKIAYNLYNDTNKEVNANLLFSNFIIKAVEAIENNEIDEAINIYKEMTLSLAKKFNIEVNYIEPKDVEINNIDMKFLGHARKKRFN